MQVEYTTGGDKHWVGVEGVVEKDGKTYFSITQTSINDGKLAGTRSNVGWQKTEEGMILVPSSKAHKMEVYTNPNASESKKTQ